MIQFGALIALVVLVAAAKQHRVPALIAIAATVMLMGGFGELGATATNILGSL
ncbi:hypothetical protein [Streptomyces sp. NBC_01092]|uniref:hypothetical protein n=1 Tax=Streptomyces sp. NBC_01092 TaxID=2903748 RepID=UPI0038686350|nr:hypothetical protein OG254_14320 [Streptomyces sp. NBC_01092]